MQQLEGKPCVYIMLWSRIARTKMIKRKKERETKRAIHIKCYWEQHMPARLSVCQSVCPLSLENPSTQSQTTTELMPTPHTHTDTNAHTHTQTGSHSSLFYPTLLICTPLFIRKKDSKARRSSETCCVCLCVRLSVNVWSRELCKLCVVVYVCDSKFFFLSFVFVNPYACVHVCMWMYCQVSVTVGADLCYSNAVCPHWVFLWKLSLSLSVYY